MTIEEAQIVYRALLDHPMDTWRLENQHVLSILCKVIAQMTESSERDVQDYYEDEMAANLASKFAGPST